LLDAALIALYNPIASAICKGNSRIKILFALSNGMFDRLQGEWVGFDQSPGLSMAELLALPEPLGDLLNWMVRQGQVAVTEIAAFLGLDESQAQAILVDLCSNRFVRKIETPGVTNYCVCLAPKRRGGLPSYLWQALEDKAEDGEED